MRSFLYALFSFLVLPTFAQQAGWPKLITTATGTEIKVFEFQPQSLTGSQLKLQAAISVKETGSAEPVFGMIWGDGMVQKTQSNYVSGISNITITNLKVPGVSEVNDVNELKGILQDEIPKFRLNIPVAELQSAVAANENQSKLSGAINTNPPKIVFSKTASILVFVDGEPQLEKNINWGVDQVVNTPFTIIKNNDQRYYLYGNKKWFRASSVTGNWSYIDELPSSLSQVERDVRKADTSAVTDNTIPNVIVSTVPAELIQSKGEPNFAPVQGTNLLYMTNTKNDIFMDINTQQYYVLISGRWYKAPGLNANWTYTPSDNLPADFAKIPEGSAKDAVLASIAGTPAAEESVLYAQVPQTAKVDRNTATANVDYDGEPQFEQIEGTDMKYAVNTPGAVINEGRKYYYIENGVWFESDRANGPWVVATERPYGVENIPPTSPVYNVKYVYIYDYTPDYVYMGYTPGYLGTYIYGNTIVYGTGYHYRPWRGSRYYARPITWGFNMRYNPWSGWNFGIGFGSGWFYSEVGSYNYFGEPVSIGGCSYGWWGQSVYRPQYERRYGNYYGNNVIINNNYIVSNDRYNNVYRSRQDVVTYDRPGNNASRNYRDAGYAQSNDRAYGRGEDGNNNIRYGNAQASNDDNNNFNQRRGRFGSAGPRMNDGNLNNTRNSDQSSADLSTQRGQFSRQRNVDANRGTVPENTNSGTSNGAMNTNGRFGNRRYAGSNVGGTVPSNTPVVDNTNTGTNNGVMNTNGRFGNRRYPGSNVDGTIPSNTNDASVYGRNSQSTNQQGIDNSGGYRRIARPVEQTGSGQQNGTDDGSLDMRRMRNTNSDQPVQRERQIRSGEAVERPGGELDHLRQRPYSPDRTIENPRVNSNSEQPQRIYNPQRNQPVGQPERVYAPQRNQPIEQPQRSYNQQPSMDSRRSFPAPAQSQPEYSRPTPSPSSNDGGGNSRSESQEGQGMQRRSRVIN